MNRIWIFLLLCFCSPLVYAQNYNAVSTYTATNPQWDGDTARDWTESHTAADWAAYFAAAGSPETCALQNWREDPSQAAYDPDQHKHTTTYVADTRCVIPLPGYPPEIIYTASINYQVYSCDEGYHWGENPLNPGTYGCQISPFEPGKNNGPGAGCDGGEGHDGHGKAPGPDCATQNGAAKGPNIVAGDPVNTATGNKYIQEDDFTPDRWLTFRRFYNSAAASISTSMGARWSHSFNRTLARYSPGANTLVANRPNGVRESFQKSGTAWTTTADNPDQLTEFTDTSGKTTGYTLWVAALRHTETYSADGRLLTIQDPTGQVATLAYSDASTDPAVAPKPGLLISVTAPDGRQLSFTYDTAGLLHQVIAPDGGTFVYAHDGRNRLNSVQYPDGKTRQYAYGEYPFTSFQDMLLALTATIDENGIRYDETSYDVSGRAIYTQSPSGAGRVSIAYNADGSSDVTYPLGGVSHQAYTMVQGLARVATLDKPCGECGQPYASRTYDANSRPATYIDFKGNPLATTYDVNGLMTEEIDARGTADQRTIDTTWSTNLRVPLTRVVKDNTGKTVSKEGWDYSATGLTTAACLIDPVAAPSYTCSAAGAAPPGVRRSVMAYCTAIDGTTCPLTGLPLQIDGPRTDVTDTVTYAYYLTTDESGCATLGGTCHHLGDVKSATGGTGLVTTYVAYDKAGRPTRVQAPNGVLTDITYTPRGWLATKTIRASTDGAPSASDAVTTIAYNPDGTVQQVKDADGVTASYTYDTAHRLTDVADGSWNRVHYTLDAAGNRTSEQVLTSSGTVVRSLGRTFNPLGQLTALTDGLGRTVFSANSADSYDANGNLAHTIDGLGIQKKHVFDGLDRLISTLNDYQGSNTATANSQSVTTFDALDRTTGFSDPDGLNTTYDIDALGNATGLHSPDTGTTTRTFDVAGNVTSSTDATNVSHTSTFDAVNRPLTTTYADAALNVQYKYDEADSVTGCTGNFGKGHLTRIVEGNGGIAWCYDSRGNVIKKQQTVGTDTRTTTYTWTLANRLQSVTTPNGTAIAYVRNPLGQITSVTATPSGGATTTVASAVAYRPFGPVASYLLGDGQTVTLTYDATGALTDIVSTAFSLHVKRDAMGTIVALGDTAGVATPTETYGYDPLYRLTGVKAASGSDIEAYTYNRTGDRLTKAAPGLLTGTYNYDPNTHHLMGVGTTSRQVDARGNTTADVLASGAYGFGYNARNRLTVVQNNGVTVGSYVINALGQRVQKTTGNASTRFDYDEGSRLLAESADTTSRDYVWMGNMPVGIIVHSGAIATTSFIHADGLGSPRAVTNSTGLVLWQWAYASNPFGEKAPTSTAGYTLNLRFPGQFFDAESGLSYNTRRDYEAASGRYLQSDPLGFRGGTSTYIYAGGSPLQYVDPLGLNYAAQWAAGGAVIGGTVTLGASVAADAVTGGVNFLATPAEVYGGTAVGAGIGYVAGTVADWISGPSDAYATAPENAYDPEGPKAPGKPGDAEGFEDPKGGESWVKNPNPYAGGSSYGWLDSKGRVWCPTGQGGRAHGGPHWDVQDGRGNINVRPGENINDF